MRSIPNKQTGIKINIDDEGTILGKYSDLIKLLIRVPPPGGYSYDDIEMRINISKALKSESIELEEAQFRYLRDLVQNAKWSFWHEDLLTFRNDICQ